MSLFRWLYYRRLRRANLFPYWDGRRMRRADGLALWKRFVSSSKLNDPLILQRIEAEDREAAEEFLDALAELFGVRRYDPGTGRGLTEAELTAVFCDFSDWVREKKNWVAMRPTPSPTTAPSRPSSYPGAPSGPPPSSFTASGSGPAGPPPPPSP